MCRFIAYFGKPILPADILVQPKNSLINQSIHARELPTHPLNGDGFGLAWYNHDIDYEPAVFKSMRPAWNDTNLIELAQKIQAKCFFAHIRAASNGGVSLFNTHPFKHKELLFMHNGDVGDFLKIKRHLRHMLSDDIYEWTKGQTDSEHFFALFLENYLKEHDTFHIDAARATLLKTIEQLNTLRATYHIDAPAFLNVVITDGFSAVAMRYVSDPKLEARTLYYALGSHYECRNKESHMHPKASEKNEAVLVVSEKLNNDLHEWVDVPNNHFLTVDKALNVEVTPI